MSGEADARLDATLFAALHGAHGRAAAHEALDAARAATGATPHAVRRALAALADDPARTSGLVWPTLQGLREYVAALDASLAADLRAALARDPLAAARTELRACEHDAPRVAATVDAVYAELAPPAARATALLVDVLRADDLGAARAAAYAQLVAHGADIRGPLADDTVLSVTARTEVLGLLAARRADAGRQHAVTWEPDARAALLSALSDWTRFATHPRQLLYRYRTRAGLGDEAAYFDALRALAGAPLAPEVAHQIQRELAGQPAALPARALGAGTYECGVCGDRRLAVAGRHAMDTSDPAQGAELEFACHTCGTRYFAAWEPDTLVGRSGAPPCAWSVA